MFVFCFVFLIQYNIKIPNMASTICEKGKTNAHNSLKLTTLLVTKGHVESLIHLSNKGKYILSGNLRREHQTTRLQ